MHTSVRSVLQRLLRVYPIVQAIVSEDRDLWPPANPPSKSSLYCFNPLRIHESRVKIRDALPVRYRRRYIQPSFVVVAVEQIDCWCATLWVEVWFVLCVLALVSVWSWNCDRYACYVFDDPVYEEAFGRRCVFLWVAVGISLPVMGHPHTAIRYQRYCLATMDPSCHDLEGLILELELLAYGPLISCICITLVTINKKQQVF
jgi:hypothetical protein